MTQKKTFEEVMARERTLLDEICNYLSKIDITKLGELTTEQIQTRFDIDYTDLRLILKVSPMNFLENFKADWALTHIARHKKYWEMPIDELARAFGFSRTENFKAIFKKYNACDPEIYCQIFLNQDKMVKAQKQKTSPKKTKVQPKAETDGEQYERIEKYFLNKD